MVSPKDFHICELTTPFPPRLNLETGKIMDHVKFETGNLVMISGGNNIGRVGTITHEEKHPGSFDTWI